MHTEMTPLYVSPASWKTLWNRYYLFSNRVEIHCSIFFFHKRFIIPREEIVAIQLYQPPVARTSLWALKLDFADLSEHVGITRSKGLFKKLRFTPDNPPLFVAKAKELIGTL